MGPNWCFHDWCCIKKVVERLVCFYHITYHILCNSHTLEKFDLSNLSVLSKLEKNVKLQDTLESINLSLKPFFHGKKTVVEASIAALLKLVTYDKSTNSCSLADEFDYIAEREGKTKHMSFYHQRRFAKLGYSAGSIIAALDLLQVLLHETEKDNFSSSLANCTWSVNFYLLNCKPCLLYSQSDTTTVKLCWDQ